MVIGDGQSDERLKRIPSRKHQRRRANSKKGRIHKAETGWRRERYEIRGFCGFQVWFLLKAGGTDVVSPMLIFNAKQGNTKMFAILTCSISPKKLPLSGHCLGCGGEEAGSEHVRAEFSGTRGC